MQIDSKRAVRTAAYLLFFYVAIRYGLPLIAPFIVGLSVAAAVQKPAGLLSSRIPCISRKICCVIMTSAILFAAAAMLYFALCAMIEGAVSFCPGIPDRLDKIRQLAAQASHSSKDASAWGRFTAFAASGANWCIDFFTENYRQYMPSVLGRSTRLIAGLPSLMTATVFAVLSALFGCGEFDKIKSSVRQWLPPETARSLSLIIGTSVSTVSALVKTYGTLMLITFAELVAGLGFMSLTGHAVGNVITIALVISLIDILPVLGTGTVLIPWGLFEMLSGRLTSGIMLLALFAVIEAVRNLLEPRLIAGRLQLHPIFTLAGVYVGGKLFGASGIFVMPLAMMIFRRLHHQKKEAAE